MIFMCILSFVLAFLYGIITDFWTLSFLSSDGLTLETVIAVYSASVLFNVLHGIGNVVFCILLYKPLKQKLIRIRTKYGIISQ
jgi:energy-coupling factor transport system substrate-specific component